MFKDFSAKSSTGAVTVTDLHLYLSGDGGLYTGGVPLIVDETGDIMLPNSQYNLFLGWESTPGRYSGWEFKSPSFSAIRGYQEMSIAQIKSDYSGFDFVQYKDEATGETSPFTYTLNYKYDDAKKTLWVTNLGLAEYAIPFTIEGNDAYVDNAYYMYDLYDTQGNALDEAAFMATVTLDGISANPVGVGCAATIDNSDLRTPSSTSQAPGADSIRTATHSFLFKSTKTSTLSSPTPSSPSSASPSAPQVLAQLPLTTTQTLPWNTTTSRA